jgi:hypothetical protein
MKNVGCGYRRYNFQCWCPPVLISLLTLYPCMEAGQNLKPLCVCVRYWYASDYCTLSSYLTSPLSHVFTTSLAASLIHTPPSHHLAHPTHVNCPTAFVCQCLAVHSLVRLPHHHLFPPHGLTTSLSHSVHFLSPRSHIT